MFTAMFTILIAANVAYAQDDETPFEDAETTDSAEDGFEFQTTGQWKDEEINPKLLLDNGAYTLSRNEVLISPLRVSWGVLDNVEIGTNLIFDVFEIYNIRGKVTAISMDRFDASFATTYYQPEISQLLDVQQVDADVLELEWRASWRATSRLGIHGGQGWYLAEVGGDDFSLGDFGAALAQLFGEDLSDEIQNEINDRSEGTTLYGGVNLNVRRNVVAADYMLNRRDQLILVWSALTQARGSVEAGANTEFQSELGDNTTFGLVASFDIPANEVLSNSVTIAWQFNWDQFHLRLGLTPPVGGVDENTAIFNTLTEGVQAYWIF